MGDDQTRMPWGVPPPAEDRLLARRTDPATSRIAAREVVSEGLLGRQEAAVLQALGRCHKPVTSAELAGTCGLDRYQCARRLPGLREKGRVLSGAPRKCRRTDRMAMVWWVAP